MVATAMGGPRIPADIGAERDDRQGRLAPIMILVKTLRIGARWLSSGCIISVHQRSHRTLARIGWAERKLCGHVESTHIADAAYTIAW
jgi:hypothetical protein